MHVSERLMRYPLWLFVVVPHSEICLHQAFVFVSCLVCLHHTHQCVYVHVHVYVHVMHACSELLLGTLRGSFSVCTLCVSLSELLLGVVAPHSEVFLVYAFYV